MGSFGFLDSPAAGMAVSGKQEVSRASGRETEQSVSINVMPVSLCRDSMWETGGTSGRTQVLGGWVHTQAGGTYLSG